VYFVVWGLLAYGLSAWSRQQDQQYDEGRAARLRGVSALGLILLFLTTTFAAVDWGMSLAPHWFSTIYGVLFIVGAALSALSFTIVLLARLSAEEPFQSALQPVTVHDLGKLLLAFTMLWAYFNVSQFIIIWSANLPEEITWYLVRTTNGWRMVTIGLVIVHFVLPFVILLSRTVKRRPGALATVAAALLLARVVDVYWMIVPAFHEGGFALCWLDVAAFLAVGGLFVGLAIRQLGGRSLVPLHDPSLPIGVEHA
jgi:hypothetical protein